MWIAKPAKIKKNYTLLTNTLGSLKVTISQAKFQLSKLYQSKGESYKIG